MNSWWFRMKPRSILRTIEWFPSFAKLEGQDWNEVDRTKISKKTGRPVNVTRRKYIYDAHGEDYDITFDELLSGQYDTVEIESNARNDKISYEFYGFGYVDNENIVRVTDVGKLIVNKKLNSEYFLKQLLKIQFPSPIVRKKHEDGHVFAMEILLNTFREFDYLTQLEIALLFGCMDINSLDSTINAIKQFRKEYSSLENKANTKKIIEIYHDILKDTYPKIDNKPETYIDYADAFIRAVIYTGLFLTRGRGLYTKLYIPEHSKTKVKLLQDKHKFIYNDEQNLDLYMKYFGDPYNIKLPWDNPEDRKIIVENKLESYKNIIREALKIDKELQVKDISEIEKIISTDNYKELIELDEELSENLLTINERLFILSFSKTQKTRDEIIEKFEDIDSGNEDMAALWLEVNTWKSLVAINGEHHVKRNFKLEEDLTPRSFAPGVGNTPDMEVYVNGYILIPEVSLMSGVKQWIHEGSSVIDHVLSFINKYKEKKVFGIFVSKAINVRTMWQFFVLNRESWVGKNVPVIPLTIKQYINIIKFIYEHELDIHVFIDLIVKINENALSSPGYVQWESSIEKIIENWKAEVLFFP